MSKTIPKRYNEFTQKHHHGEKVKTFKSQMGFLLLGFVFWLPIGVIVLVASTVSGALEPIGKDLLGLVFSDRYLYSGTGIGFWVAVMFLTGLMLKSTPFGRYASAIPILGTFFLRLDGETMTIDRLMNLTPCLFLYSPTCVSYGWILSEQPITIGCEVIREEMLNVYYPNVPTILTGQVFAARKETVMKLGNSSRDVLDVLLYGLRRPDTLQYLPWTDEPEEEFKQRSRKFGIA